MSANTSTLIEKIAQIERQIQEARNSGTSTAALEVAKLALVKELNEANAALTGKELLKG